MRDDLYGRFFYEAPWENRGDVLRAFVVAVHPPEGSDNVEAEDSETGATGELVLRWVDLPRSPPHGSPRLDTYWTSWPVLAANPEIVKALASVPADAPSPEQVARALEGIGFRRVNV